MNRADEVDPTGQLEIKQGSACVAFVGACCTLGGVLYYEAPANPRCLQSLGSKLWLIPGAAVLLYSIDYLLFLIWFNHTGRAVWTLTGSLISEYNYGKPAESSSSWECYAYFGRTVPIFGVFAWIPVFIGYNWSVLGAFVTLSGSLIPKDREGCHYEAVRMIGSLPILGFVAWIGYFLLLLLDSKITQTIIFGGGNLAIETNMNKSYFFLSYIPIFGGLFYLSAKAIALVWDSIKKNVAFIWNEFSVFRALLTLGGSLVCLSERMKANNWYQRCAKFGRNTPIFGFLAYFLICAGLVVDFVKSDVGQAMISLGGSLIPKSREGIRYEWVRNFGSAPVIGFTAWFGFFLLILLDLQVTQTILLGGGNLVVETESNKSYYFLSKIPFFGGLFYLSAKSIASLWASKLFKACVTLGGSLIENFTTTESSFRNDVLVGFGMLPIIGFLAWIPFAFLKFIDSKIIQTLIYGGGNWINRDDENDSYYFLSNIFIVGGLAYFVAKFLNSKMVRGITTLGANIFLPDTPSQFGKYPVYTNYLKPLANAQLIGIPVHVFIWVAYFPFLSCLILMEKIWFRPSMRIGIWKIRSFFTVLKQRIRYPIRYIANETYRLKIRYIVNRHWEWRTINGLAPLGSMSYVTKPPEECIEEPLVLTMERYKLQLEMYDTTKVSRCALDTVNLALGLFVKNQASSSKARFIPAEYKMYADTQYRDRFGAPLFNHRNLSVLKVAQTLANSPGCTQDALLELKHKIRILRKDIKQKRKTRKMNHIFVATFEKEVNQVFIDFLNVQEAENGSFNILAVEHATFVQSEVWTRNAICSSLNISEETLLWILSRRGDPESFCRGRRKEIDYRMYALHHIVNRANTHAGPWEFEAVLTKMKDKFSDLEGSISVEVAEAFVEEAVLSILELASELPPLAHAAV